MKFAKLILIIFISSSCAKAQTLNRQESRSKSQETDVNKKYTVKVSDGDSRCQILINDVPLMYYEGSGERSFFANSAILKSGKQSIKIITSGKTPLVNIVETNSKSGEYGKIEIWKNDGALKGYFTANVPNVNIGWDNSKIISKDSKMLSEANAWFQKMGSLLELGKGPEFMKQIIPAEKVAALMYNLSEEETATFHNNWINFISKKAYSLVPLSECKIEITGNDKLFHLTNKLGEGGFALKADNGQIFYLDIYLHAPTSSNYLKPVLANFKQVTTNFKKRVEN